MLWAEKEVAELEVLKAEEPKALQGGDMDLVSLHSREMSVAVLGRVHS